jgi:hypothetical protein
MLTFKAKGNVPALRSTIVTGIATAHRGVSVGIQQVAYVVGQLQGLKQIGAFQHTEPSKLAAASIINPF